MSDNKLKIDVVLADVGESGAVLSDFVTQDLHNTDMAKKADLVNGKVNPTQLPEFSELSGVTDVFSQLENNLRENINISLAESKEYADSIVSEVMSKKADLVNGRVPKEQATNFKDIPGAKAAIDGLKQSLGQEIIGINDSLENNFAKLTNGKVSQTVLPTNLVYSDHLTREMNDVRSSLQNTITQVGEELTALETKTNNKFISKTEAEYFTKDIELKAAIDGLEQKSYTSYASKIVETSKADLTYVDAAVGAISTDASKQYATLALANADIANIALNQNVFVSEDVNGGYWYKATAGATTLAKSPYDPVELSKVDATTKANAAEQNAKAYIQPLKDVYRTDILVPGYAFAWVSVDPNNTANIKIAGGIKDDGTLHFSEQLLQKLVANIAVLDDLSVTNQINGRTLSQITDVIAGYVSNTFDIEMKACGGIKEDGTLHYHSAEFEYLNGVKVSDFLNGTSSDIYPKFDAEINFIVGHGQSLFQGQTPAVTTTQKYDTIAFKGHAINPIAWSVATATTAAANNQEIPTLGASEYVKDLILSENNISMAQQNYQLLLGNGAYGGQTIAALSKGGMTGGYEELISQINSGYTISQAQNKVFKVPCIMWVQGEGDYWKSQKEYYDSLIKLRNDFESDTKVINGQTEDVVLIASQTTSWGQTDYSRNVQLAMIQASEDDKNIVISAPQYMYQYRDDTYFAHISPAQTRILGAYMGLAYKRHIIDGVKWQPLKMVKAQAQGNVIYVTFNRSGLVIDNTLVAPQANAGFSLRKADNTEITITSVSVVQPNVIKIVASSNPKNADLWLGGKLATGINFYKGGATNIRDNQGDTLTFDSYPLHNWAVIHKVQVI